MTTPSCAWSPSGSSPPDEHRDLHRCVFRREPAGAPSSACNLSPLDGTTPTPGSATSPPSHRRASGRPAAHVSKGRLLCAHRRLLQLRKTCSNEFTHLLHSGLQGGVMPPHQSPQVCVQGAATQGSAGTGQRRSRSHESVGKGPVDAVARGAKPCHRQTTRAKPRGLSQVRPESPPARSTAHPSLPHSRSRGAVEGRPWCCLSGVQEVCELVATGLSVRLRGRALGRGGGARDAEEGWASGARSGAGTPA